MKDLTGARQWRNEALGFKSAEMQIIGSRTLTIIMQLGALLVAACMWWKQSASPVSHPHLGILGQLHKHKEAAAKNLELSKSFQYYEYLSNWLNHTLHFHSRHVFQM